MFRGYLRTRSIFLLPISLRSDYLSRVCDSTEIFPFFYEEFSKRVFYMELRTTSLCSHVLYDSRQDYV